MLVLKRDGKKEPFSADKPRKWVRWAVREVDQQVEKEYTILSELLTRLPKEASTEDIHQTIIKICLEKEDLEYSRVAAELEMATILKNRKQKLGILENDSFTEILEVMEDRGLWKGEWLTKLTQDQLRQLDLWYITLSQETPEYWTVKQWSDKYSISVSGLPVETPATGALAISLSLHGFSDIALQVATDIVEGRLNLPTPMLNGGRNGNYDTISCCVIEGGDTVDSLDVASVVASKMTAKKAGIGIMLNTRAKGDPVKDGTISHLGKLPLYQELEKAVKKYTQLSRGGSATMAYRCIDPDIMSLLLWKTQRIDLSQRVDKIDYNFVYNDAFVEAVLNNSDWYLFSPYFAPEVHDNFHSKNFMFYVKKALRAGVPHAKVKAVDVLIEFLEARAETSRVYCMNATRSNEHTPFIEHIKQSNLCVAPETKVLTDKGHITISEYAGQEVSVWNGKEYSKVTLQKTGTNQKLLKVILASGEELYVTEHHKFYSPTGPKNQGLKELRTHELEAGTKLIKLDTPVIEGQDKLPLAYENGFFSADGCYSASGDRLYFYGDKRCSVLPNIDTSTMKTKYEQENRTYLHLDGLQKKFFVPGAEYSVKSRLEWFAGYIDGDGSVYRNGKNEQLVAASINKEFLLDVKLMLQTLGVQSKITSTKGTEGKQSLPLNDGSGEYGLFDCKQQYRLIITSNGLHTLVSLGLKCNRLSFEGTKPQRDARRFSTVAEIIDDGRYDDTYCFMEPKRHMGVFNGVLTGQCMEIQLPTKPFKDLQDLVKYESSEGEVAFCALSAINVSRVSLDGYMEAAYRTLRTVHEMIIRAGQYQMSEAMSYNLLRRRSVGVGITGLAGYLYEKGLDYDGSKESVEAVAEIAELHCYALYKASQRMVEEGLVAPVEGIDAEWLPIDTSRSSYEPALDWEKLRGKPRGHSVLVAHMPTESSSPMSGATNGVYPSRDRVTYKKARTGKVQFISQFFDSTKTPAWNVNMVPYYSVIQDFSDQAISADYYIDFNSFENRRVPAEYLISWFVEQWAAGIKTAYYQNNRESTKDAISNLEPECTSCKL